MRYFLEISYHGGQYHGWQAQENTTQTVQGELDKALGLVLRQPIESVGSGRTDTGVHCRSQFVHLDVAQPIADPARFLYKLNRCLPADIAALALRPVVPEAHARFSALTRSYEYHLARQKSPLALGVAYQYTVPLDLAQMNLAAAKLLNYADFESFSRVKTDVKTFRCQLFHAYWEQDGPRLVFYIQADRFLRGMVRTIVGTLLDVGRGQLAVGDIDGIVQGRDRTRAGRAVPPQGLFLTAVSYPPEIFA
jgi:tRNA pseudouridine38-40 synthase